MPHETTVPWEKKIEYAKVSDYIEKSGSQAARRIPQFVIRIIEKIVCQEQMNASMARHHDKLGTDFLTAMITELNLTLAVEGIENLPEKGRCFFAANHPFGIVDGLVLTHIIAQKYGTLKAIGNDAFMYIPHLRPLIASVNVFGRNPKSYVKALGELYDSDTAITHFPAGEVSRRYQGKVQDCAWQKSFITKAISSKRDIVPFHFGGTNSRLFYFINGFRRFLGIKANLELLLLPREFFKKKNSTIKVRIGKPIPWGMLDASLAHADWAQKIRQHVYNLSDGKEQLFFTL